jgi:hypothetical protein
MIVEISVGVVLGVVLGMVLTLSIITTGYMRPRILRKILNSNAEGWLIIQRGQRYTIQPAVHADGGLTVEIGDETHHFERPEMMHDLMGVPVGLALAGPTSLVDVEAAAAMGAMDPDEDVEILDEDDQLPVGEIRESLHVTDLETDDGLISIINPFTDVGGSVVDLRDVVKGLRHGGTSDLPRKAAENARLAERANNGLNMGAALQYGSLFAAFLLGGIMVEYIAGGGGAGGGSINLGLMLMPWP